MRPKQFFKHVPFILILLLLSINIKAQSPTNFSGKWQFDKAKSIIDKLEPDYDGTIVLVVTQNPTTISFSEIYTHPDRPEWKTAADSYKLDGKEQIKKSDIGTSKSSAKWSEDKKVLTITNLDTQKLKGVLQDFLIVDTYNLSDDGKTLTIERYRKNPVTGETKAKKVYLKK